MISGEVDVAAVAAPLATRTHSCPGGGLASALVVGIGATAATGGVVMTTAAEFCVRFFFLPFLGWATKGVGGANGAMKGLEGCW